MPKGGRECTTRNPYRRVPMPDLAFLAAFLAFFALCALFVRACDYL